ncbi:MAG: hypothetical protein J5973_03695, partial [Eubacterium sp.]|nr:hypothetical protein [Eubacterium sp.]
LHVLSEYQKWLLSPERKAPRAEREYAAKQLKGVMEKIKGSVRKVKDKIFSLLQNPKRKAEILAPVKHQGRQSVLAFLKKAREETDTEDARQRSEIIVRKDPKKRTTNVRI